MVRFCNVLITHKCNLNCLHCYQGKDKKIEASYESIVSTLEMLRERGITSIQLSGGECTTHERIIDIARIAKQLGMQISIFTNGQHLPDELLNFVDSFFFSLDGSEDVHNYIRRDEQAFKNLEASVDKVIAKTKKLSIQITLTSINIDKIEDVFEWLDIRQKHIQSIRLVKAVPIGNMCNWSAHVADEEIFDKIKKLKEKIAERYDYHVQISDNIYSKKAIKDLLLCDTKVFPLWVDILLGKYYMYANRYDISGDISGYDENEVMKLNDKLKDILSEAVKRNDIENVSIDDILAVEE